MLSLDCFICAGFWEIVLRAWEIQGFLFRVVVVGTTKGYSRHVPVYPYTLLINWSGQVLLESDLSHLPVSTPKYKYILDNFLPLSSSSSPPSRSNEKLSMNVDNFECVKSKVIESAVHVHQSVVPSEEVRSLPPDR